jgi:cytochrome c biogenesis protein CcmG/thiol:disulfide interchange protein DsbE
VKHPFRWVAIGAGVVIALFAAILAANVTTDPQTELNTSHLLGKAAPAFTLTKLDGTTLESADLAGKTVIVIFWNSWCEPCLAELPTLQRWYADHRSDPSVVMVGIPRDDSSSAIRDAARTDHMGWAVTNDRGAEDANLAFGTRGQPESFVISPSGQIVGSVIGPLTTANLDKMLQVGQGI